MTTISSLIAKVLVLVDAVLTDLGISASTSASTDNCGYYYALDGTISGCGVAFVKAISQTVYTLANLFPVILNS